jgi:hypothetical protein
MKIRTVKVSAHGEGQAPELMCSEGVWDRFCDLVVRVPGYRSRGQRFDSQRYHIFWEIVGLERGPLSLVSTNEELLGRKSSGSGLEIREYGRREPSRFPRGTLCPQKVGSTNFADNRRSRTTVKWRCVDSYYMRRRDAGIQLACSVFCLLGEQYEASWA